MPKPRNIAEYNPAYIIHYFFKITETFFNEDKESLEYELKKRREAKSSIDGDKPKTIEEKYYQSIEHLFGLKATKQNFSRTFLPEGTQYANFCNKLVLTYPKTENDLEISLTKNDEYLNELNDLSNSEDNPLYCNLRSLVATICREFSFDEKSLPTISTSTPLRSFVQLLHHSYEYATEPRELKSRPPSKPDKESVITADMEEARLEYVNYLERNECKIQLIDMPTNDEIARNTVDIELEKLFVPLHITALPSELEEDISDMYIDNNKNWLEILSEWHSSHPITAFGCFRAVIFAGPGGGKTTWMRRIVSAYGLSKLDNIDDNLPSRSLFPLFIKCRDYSDSKIFSLVQIIRDIPRKVREEYGINIVDDSFFNLSMHHIDKGTAMILIDGLDEISDDKMRRLFIDKINKFAKGYPKANILVTSRTVGFQLITSHLFDDFQQWCILPFNNKDIERLCIGWNKVLEGDTPKSLSDAKKLSAIIVNNENIRKLAEIPVLLTTLLLLNKKNGRLPLRRTELYEKAIEELLYSWNGEVYEPIDIRKALPHLSYLAYNMVFNVNSRKIGQEDLLESLITSKRDMEQYALPDPIQFIDYVEKRSSLLVKRGMRKSEKSRDLEGEYAFRHPSFQDYLAAYAIVKRRHPNASRFKPVSNIFSEAIKDVTIKDDAMLKEVMLFTAALSELEDAQSLYQAIVSQIEIVKNSSPANRNQTINFFKRLLIQMLAEGALSTANDRTLIYSACFSGSMNSSVLQNEFVSLYSSEHKAELIAALLRIEESRLSPLYIPLLNLFKKREADPEFSAYTYFINNIGTENILEAINILDIASFLGITGKKPDFDVVQRIKSELRALSFNSELMLAYSAYQALYFICEEGDAIFSVDLFAVVTKLFDANPSIGRYADKFQLSKEILEFSKTNPITQIQSMKLQEKVSTEPNYYDKIRYFWFGVLGNAWTFESIIKTAREIDAITNIDNYEKSEFFNKMWKYISILKENNRITREEDALANDYLIDMGILYEQSVKNLSIFTGAKSNPQDVYTWDNIENLLNQTHVPPKPMPNALYCWDKICELLELDPLPPTYV